MLTQPQRHCLWLTAAALVAGGCGDGISEPLVETQVEEPGPCDPLGELEPGDSESGVLEGTDCPAPNGHTTDRWTLAVTASTYVRIDLTSHVFDPVLELLDASGNGIAWNDDGGEGVNARILKELPSGTYTLVVHSYAPNSGGPYGIMVSEAPECGPIGTVALGDTVEGTIEGDDCPSEWGGRMDRWSFSVDEQARVQFVVQGDMAPLEVLLQDASGHVVNGAYSNEPGRPARFDADVTTGSWTVVVTHPWESGVRSYELSAAPAPPCDPGGEVVLGEPLTDALTLDGCLFHSWAPADSVGLTLTEETDVAFRLKSPDFIPMLLVFDENGMEVLAGWADWATGVVNARGVLPAGSYGIYVLSADERGLGSYELLASEVTCEAAGTVALGATVQGSLNATDCARSGGAYTDAWTLDLEEEQAVRMDLSSTDFDAFLILLDEAGKEVARNDDGGSGYDARIDATLAAGRYSVVATSFVAGQMGAYTLSVGAPPATAASAAEATAGAVVLGKSSVVPRQESGGGGLQRLQALRADALARLGGASPSVK